MGGWSRRPALDGLRAVALAMVLLSHGGVGVVGGAIGVDVFLVLSGYLITGLLLLELDTTGRVDLRAFWMRRVRRLVPAAVVLVAVVAVFGDVDPADAGAALGWWSNWHFGLADVGYFDAFASPSPLRHTWSLAVEEQWYLVWPLLLLGLHRTGRRLPLTLLLTLASAAAMWAVAGDVDRAHMGTDTRAQALLAGAALAMVLHRRAHALPAGASTAAGLAGAAVLGAIALRTPGSAPWLYHGGHLLVAVAAAAVVAAAVRTDGPVRTALAVRPLRAIGRVSYGAYLWHWPLFVWLTPDRTGLDPWPLLAVRVGATAAATLLSWHLVERPVLEGRPLPRPRAVVPTAAALGATVVLLTIAADPTVRPTNGSASASASDAVPELPAAYAAAPSPRALEPHRPVAPQVRGVLDTGPLKRRPDGDPVVTVVGDSSAWALGWGVNPVPGIEVRDGGTVGCGIDPAGVVVGASVRVEGGIPVPCSEALDLWRWWVASTEPDLVVLGLGAWEVYDRVLPDGRRLDVGTAAWRSWLEDGLERVVTALATAAPHARVAVAEVPCYAERDLALGGPSSARNDPERVAAVNAVLSGMVADHPARLVSLPWSPWLCGSDEFHRPDGVHLVPESARALWTGPLGQWVVGELSRGSAPAS